MPLITQYEIDSHEKPRKRTIDEYEQELKKIVKKEGSKDERRR